MIELRTETSTYKQGRTIEFYERHGDTRTVYRFDFPQSKAVPPSFEQVDVGLKDGYYHEHPRVELAEDTKKLFKILEKKSKGQDVRETHRQFVGLSKIETIYFDQSSAA